MAARLFFGAIFSLFVLTGCSTSDKKNMRDVANTENETPEVIGTHYTTVVFDKGKSTLSRDNKDLLRELLKKAHKDRRVINEIRILAWADDEYPEAAINKAPSSDVILASERAREIRDYFEEDLKEEKDIDSFNMARRPDFLSTILRDDEFKVKNAFEASGATASKLPDGSVSYSKASKALVIIDYEGDEDNLK